MTDQTHLTIGQVAEIYGIPDWKIRRVVDSLDLPVMRIRLYRMVPRESLGIIAAELQRQGWLPAAMSGSAQ